MKNISISLGAILLIIGCGLDKKDLNDIPFLNENERVDYLAEGGSYDLAKYLVPNENQTNIYQVKKIMDVEVDNQNYQHPQRNFNEEIKYDVEGNQIKVGVDISYNIKAFAIERVEVDNDGFYDFRKYRRFVDINDTYYSYEAPLKNNPTGSFEIMWLRCNLEEHNNTVKVLDKTYNDVLTLVCNSKSDKGVRGEFHEYISFFTRFMYAKHIGQISVYGERNTTKQYDTTSYSHVLTLKELKEIKKENN